MAEKVTTMVLKVDLQCCKCYKRVKKVLCKFPQIQDQVYDEKNNKVVIKVVSCCPEKIRDKLCCKGRGCIKSIEILEPPKPQPPPPPPPKPQPPPPPPPAPSPPPPPKPEGDYPDDHRPIDKPPVQRPPPPECEGDDRKTCGPIHKPTVQPPQADRTIAKPAEPLKPDLPPPPTATLATGYPPPLGPVPVGFCCTDCYHGHGGGPCYNPCYEQGFRYYDGYYGRPVSDSWGGGGGYRGYYGKRCGDCFSYENPQGCTIM